MRATRFREKAGCIAWRGGSEKLKTAEILSIIGPWIQGNFIHTMPTDLSKAETLRVSVAGKGTKPENRRKFKRRAEEPQTQEEDEEEEPNDEMVSKYLFVSGTDVKVEDTAPRNVFDHSNTGIEDIEYPGPSVKRRKVHAPMISKSNSSRKKVKSTWASVKPTSTTYALRETLAPQEVNWNGEYHENVDRYPTLLDRRARHDDFNEMLNPAQMVNEPPYCQYQFHHSGSHGPDIVANEHSLQGFGSRFDSVPASESILGGPLPLQDERDLRVLKYEQIQIISSIGTGDRYTDHSQNYPQSVGYDHQFLPSSTSLQKQPPSPREASQYNLGEDGDGLFASVNFDPVEDEQGLFPSE